MADIQASLLLSAPLIQHYEVCSLSPYQNRGDVPTIGWGNTHYQDGTAVTLNDPDLSQQDADELFVFFLNNFSNSVAVHVPSALPNELAAFTSLAYNIGSGAFERSSTLREYLRANKIMAGKDIELWNQSMGRVLKGLQRRRRAEHLVFSGTPVITAIAQAEEDYP